MGAGESYDDNAAREVEEEMGVKGVPLEPLFKFYFADDVTRCWGKAFRCVYDGPIALQARRHELISAAMHAVKLRIRLYQGISTD